MAQSVEESLLQAIKKDDIKAFNALMEKAQCGTFRLGRFPVLSLLYLYKSRKIVSEYEEKFLKVTKFELLREPIEISKKFSQKAGKCLRLYLNEVVSPLEMLLILDKAKRLKQIYPSTKPSTDVKERLKLIYSIKYSLAVKFEGNDIIIDRRPLSYREKKNIAAVCLCSVLAVTLAVGVPVATVAIIPKPVAGEVTKLSQIDFSSQEEYTLKKDIVLPENYSVEKVNCNIVGAGKKLIIGRGATLGELNGNISDLIIESSGNAVFTSVSENAAIENITVNVSADVTVSESTALVAETNYGTIDGVTVNVSGSISAQTADETVDEFYLGGLVMYNRYKSGTSNKIYWGTIKNCTVNYSNLSLVGVASADASFGGVTGINSAYVQDCTVTGEIIADTVDVAGVCIANSGLLSGNINKANLSQTSSDAGWNPITCGIVLDNLGVVESCENRGDISAVSNGGQTAAASGNEPAATAAGIAYLNRGSSSNYIKNCVNYGNVESSAEYRNAYASGVCRSSSCGIEECENRGSVSANANNGYDTYAGGITALAYGYLYKCVNEGAVKAKCSGAAYAGGLSSYSYSQFLNCISKGEITVTAQNVYAGGIFGISEASLYSFNAYYCGTAEYCISENKITVMLIGDETSAFVGGIAGCVREIESYGNSVIYLGGITNCYFIGECVSKVTYFGNIVGVCGEKIYETNSYFSGNKEYHNFDENYFLDNSISAFGAKVTSNGEYIEVEDKGATPASLEDIKNSEAYKSILSALEG